MKKIKLYPNPLKDIAEIFTGDNFMNLSDYTIRILTAGGLSIFESKINEQTFEIDVSTLNHKGPCIVQVIDIMSRIIDVRKIILE
jgi:hypothetical protein